MAKNLEANLIDANGKYINFDAHREEYTQHYDALRKELYSQWRSNKVLDKILKGHTLGGSYGDNLKVAMPNEFDLVIHLVFPENDKIIVKADPRKPGNVTLDMTKVMEIIGKQDHNKPVFEQLQKMVNRNQLLCEDKLQSWLQGVMTTTLNKMDKQIKVGSVVSPLSYKKSGPAHTIDVKGRYVYSVDFVPAIRLKAAQCVLGPEQKRHFGTTPHWDAIPKPMKPSQPENISFRASYYEAEKGLLQDKHNLKNSIRLMKRLRDTKNNMANLKSYYIKTLFLWEVTKQDSKYWQKPMYEIVTEMLDRLSNTLKLTSSKGKLLFFWDPKLDMFAELTDRQRQEMFNCVSKTQYLFRRGDGNLTGDIEKNILNYFNNPGRGIENIPDNSQCKGNGTKPKDPTKQNNPQPAQKISKAAKPSLEAVKKGQPTQAAPGQPKKQDAKQPINPNRKPSEQKVPAPVPVQPNKPNQPKAENQKPPQSPDSKPQPPPEGKKEESSCSIC